MKKVQIETDILENLCQSFEEGINNIYSLYMHMLDTINIMIPGYFFKYLDCNLYVLL